MSTKSSNERVKLPKLGTVACRDFFLSWGEINVFFGLVVDMVGYIEEEANRQFEGLLGGAEDDEEYDRLLQERESWRGPAVLLKEREQFFFEIILVRHIENYLNYLSGLLFEIFTQRPETLRSRETIKLETVLSHDSMDDLIRAIAQGRVDSLSYEAFDKLIDYFDDRFGLVLFPVAEAASVAEAVETRNISVHNRCTINERYVKRTGAPESLIGTRRELSNEEIVALVAVLRDGVSRLDAQARKKLKLRATVFDVEKLLDAAGP
jgi:hypothetical protein